MEQVTPRLEHTPVRTYKRSGNMIECYAVLPSKGKEIDMEVTCGDYPEFIIELFSEEIAEQLMEDLYYGEYTGA